MKTLSALLFYAVLASEIFAQVNFTEEGLLKIGAKFGPSVESRTRELIRYGIPSWVEAFKLANQGIDSSALDGLQKEGIDIREMFGEWARLEYSFVFSDWILFGVIREIRLMPDIGYNKYVYVDPKMWLKGKPIDRKRVVIRTAGSGPSKDGKIWSSVSHETPYKKGDAVLLLLNRSIWELESDVYAPLDKEQFKDDYPHMCFEGWGKLLLDGEFVVSLTSDRFEEERGRWRIDSLVATIRNSTDAIERNKHK